MKVINKSKIPEALFKYLAIETYDHAAKGNSYSVTEILNPAQMVVLNRRYKDKIVVDAIDLLWIMLGNGVHAILEKEEGIEKIERLKVMVEGVELSGKWDRIFEDAITDYKVTSAWSIAYGSHQIEWLKQLSIYRWLFFKVKKRLLKNTGFIVALLRDWAERNAGKGNYPDKPALEIPFALIGLVETEEIVKRRLKIIKQAEEVSEDVLAQEFACTDEERWWDVNKKVSRRCVKYCTASKFCKQYAEEEKR